MTTQWYLCMQTLWLQLKPHDPALGFRVCSSFLGFRALGFQGLGPGVV